MKPVDSDGQRPHYLSDPEGNLIISVRLAVKSFGKKKGGIA